MTTLKDSIEAILARANEDLKMGKHPEMVVLRAVIETLKCSGQHYAPGQATEDPNPTRKEVN